MEIQLSKFGTTLSTRALAHSIFDEVKADLIVIDFDAVKEATPSFCHEMLTLLLKGKDMKIRVINANNLIKVQLNKALSSLD